MARRTKEEAQATRSALLDAAECVFLQQGVSRTTLADIAHAAGVTRGALYWHFKDKADLFNAMLDRVTSPLDADWQSLKQRGGDLLVAWQAHLQHSLHQIAHDAQTRRVLQIAMQKVEHGGEMSKVVERYLQIRRSQAECERIVLEHTAAARGVELPAPATQLAHAIHALINGLIYGWLLDPCFDLEITAGTAITAFLRGIGMGDGAQDTGQG